MSLFTKVVFGPTGQIFRNGKHKLAIICCQSNRLFSNQPTDEANHEAHNDTHAEDEKQYIDDIKQKILTASMEFVNETGWTRETLAKGAQSIGYASTVQSIFPNGSAHLVYFFTLKCNNKLSETMQKEVDAMPTGVTNPIKFIENSILTRIEMLEPYKSNWNNALATILNSRMALDHGSALMTLADDICYFAGDRSVDSTWYARRAVVGGIYQASELHWLGGGKQTRDFTASQLLIASNLEAIPKNFAALLTIARNILPINLNR